MTYRKRLHTNYHVQPRHGISGKSNEQNHPSEDVHEASQSRNAMSSRQDPSSAMPGHPWEIARTNTSSIVAPPTSLAWTQSGDHEIL
jgi:hypothetical protein